MQIVAFGEQRLALATKLERAAVSIAGRRQKRLAGQIGLGRPPIDVEELRVRRTVAVLEHVVPPAGARTGDTHVIGRDVQNQANSAPSETPRELGELFLRTDLRIELLMIGDVVTALAAAPRREQRRGVTVADAQIVEIIRQPCGLLESKPRIELQAVSGRRDARLDRRCPILQSLPMIFIDSFEADRLLHLSFKAGNVGG